LSVSSGERFAIRELYMSKDWTDCGPNGTPPGVGIVCRTAGLAALTFVNGSEVISCSYRAPRLSVVSGCR
jgi:hypothetical protein